MDENNLKQFGITQFCAAQRIVKSASRERLGFTSSTMAKLT